MKDSVRKAKKKYKDKIIILQIELYPTEDDIKHQIAERQLSGEAKATYIKRLIREDIKQAGGDNLRFFAKKN